ncbi:hypothetical protein LOTGIDRAFT_236702 [Lottia gigantea]|uniref:Uncharacterized protein n=1 Tax=Lottia gigantea TaxID=225164 RepID=V3ZLW5_LOTGI|nr:hypothetical protein LOTGIDRAFT_236702 [Lottia gigantea]ESO83395.1 hypothetical protein LOTGIDRAFT_236702 [Lottia gigantea]
MKILAFVLLLGLSLAFDLNDPKTNLDSFIRTFATTETDVETVTYINGTVFIRIPGGSLKKVLLMDGYNIGRREKTSTGYVSLSKEFVAYRDYKTGEIIDVLINPLTNVPNEVFFITNDPVNENFTYGKLIPFTRLKNDRVTFSNDIFLEYENVLDPQHYGKFSAGPLFVGNELFQFHTRYSDLATTSIPNLNVTISWSRRSPFLPWFEMGETDGHLYYVSTSWKCVKGFGDIPDDIMNIVRRKYPKFLEAPKTYEVPNETSYSSFKAVIDQRRKEGKPDIIIPEVGIRANLRLKPTGLDPKVYESLAKLKSFRVGFSGTVYSQIKGQGSITLFNVKGEVTSKMRFTPDGLKTTVHFSGHFRDPGTGEILKRWINPLTHRKNIVPPLIGKYTHTLIKGDDSFWSHSIPYLDETSVEGAISFSQYNKNTKLEDWSVHTLDVYFTDADLKAGNPYMYGAWYVYSSWPEWMEMAGAEGILIWRINIEILR